MHRYVRVIWATSHRELTIARRVPETASRRYREFNLIVNVNKLNSLRASKYVGNNDKTSGDQCSYEGQCVFRVVDGRRFVPGWKIYGARVIIPHYIAVLNLTDIEFPMTLKNISKFERLNMMSINVLKMDRSFLCGSSMTRRRRISYKIHTTTLGSYNANILRGSKTCRVSWDRKLLGTRIGNIFAIGKYREIV